jgi:D-Tyr-tRNAtyr deacylase
MKIQKMKNKQKEFINLILEKVVKMKIFEGQEHKMKKII